MIRIIALCAAFVAASASLCAQDIGFDNDSELSVVLSAAFQEFADGGTNYSDLYRKYLGVPRSAPDAGKVGKWIPLDEVTPGSTLDEVLDRGTIRMAFWRHAPYYFAAADGSDTGFEFELAREMIERVNAHYGTKVAIEWIEKPFHSDGGGTENLLLYDQFSVGLLAGEYDVIFSGLIVKPDRPVAATTPTMYFFFNAVYTGKDGLTDLSAVQSTDRDTFVRYLASKPGVTLISSIGGPSEETATALAKEANALGGSCTARTALIAELVQAVKEQSVHFLVGDAIALSDLAMTPGFPGLNMNVSLRAGDEYVAPITRLDPDEGE